MDDTPHSGEVVPAKLKMGPLDAVLKVVGLIALLYMFLIGVSLIGESFKLIGGGAAGSLFQAANNPILGLMIGMLATALLQSSSTTTSIIVGLVGGGSLPISTAVPMIMGANIGTSVTNTFVSMGHAGDREEFKRAFAGATVHDFFNLLSVAVLLTLEVTTGFIEKLSGLLTGFLAGAGGATFNSPLKAVIKPMVKLFISIDKSKIKGASKGEIIEGSLLKGGIFQDIGLSDAAVGAIVLGGSAVLTIIALLGIVKLMKSMMQARAATWVQSALEKNAYASMGVGAAATVVVQSSSITTSTLVPMVGVGLVSLEAIFPLTLGANIGTTITALLASMAGTGDAAVLGLQIALCHLLFNILGILIWFPIPLMRNVPLSMARWIGEQVALRRWVAGLYIAVVFFLVPLSILAIDKYIF